MQSTYSCPDTGIHFEIDIPDDAKSREEGWFEPLVIACPACNHLHETEYAQVYRVGVMAQFECLPTDIQQAALQ
jgi:hypothetical protein